MFYIKNGLNSTNEITMLMHFENLSYCGFGRVKRKKTAPQYFLNPKIQKAHSIFLKRDNLLCLLQYRKFSHSLSL